MTRYAVGDLQGCLQPLQCLLEQVAFNPDRDELWLVGDLINRGPQSLETLRFVHNLDTCTRVVLGNHDLHFLAIALNTRRAGKSDTFDELLSAPDRRQLVDWLMNQPLLHSDSSGDFHMVHAGIPPQWDLSTTRSLATEVTASLRGSAPEAFLRAMYGNSPACWEAGLEGLERLRVITNYLTRMRFCNALGELDLDSKLLQSDRPDFFPWFSFQQRKTAHDQIVFGHWAALEGKASVPNVFALDTGCVWGRRMTLMNLDDKSLHHCDCHTTANDA